MFRAIAGALAASTVAAALVAEKNINLEGRDVVDHGATTVSGLSGSREKLYESLKQSLEQKEIPDLQIYETSIDRVPYLHIGWGPMAVYVYASDIGKDLLVSTTTTTRGNMKWHQYLLGVGLNQVVANELAALLAKWSESPDQLTS